MRQTYFISQTHKIESDENGQFTTLDMNLALAHIAGWRLHQIMPLGDAVIQRTAADGQVITAFIPSKDDMEEIDKLSQTYGLNAMLPLKNGPFAQVLLKSFPCVITPIVSNAGSLVGGWAVESVGTFGAADIHRAGWSYGIDEYISTFSDVLPTAIGLNVMTRVGIGKLAFFLYPEMTTSDAQLIYITQHTLGVISADPNMMDCLVAAPELDCYAFIPAPADVLEDARVLADAEAVLNKVALKQRMDQAEAEAMAEQAAAELAGGADAAPTLPQDVATDAPGLEVEPVAVPETPAE